MALVIGQMCDLWGGLQGEGLGIAMLALLGKSPGHAYRKERGVSIRRLLEENDRLRQKREYVADLAVIGLSVSGLSAHLQHWKTMPERDDCRVCQLRAELLNASVQDGGEG